MKLNRKTLRFIKDYSDNNDRKGQPINQIPVRRQATEVMNYRLTKKILQTVVAILTVIMLISYVLVLIYNRTGRFSVSVNNINTDFMLTLSESPDFKIHTSMLTNRQEVAVTNICGNSLPANLDQIDGEHNGENYLAYTFYCQNAGDKSILLRYELTFNNITNHIDEAVRVRLYVNGDSLDYAKTKSDGTGDEPHFRDRTFSGKYLVCVDTTGKVDPEEHARFTVVVWLEGDDPDCNDSIRFGHIKFDMVITALPVG